MISPSLMSAIEAVFSALKTNETDASMKIRHILMASAAVLAIAGAAFAGVRGGKGAEHFSKSDIAQNLKLFNSIYKELTMNYVDTLDAKTTMRTAIDALLGQIDPYTEYFSLEERDDITSVTTGEYAGIGSVIQRRDSVVVLTSPTWNSPARRAGVRHGDVLISIDGDSVTPAMDITEVSRRLKGRPGTEVRLRLRRPWVGADSILDITVTRGTITIDPLPYYGYIGDGIGYLDITTFNEKTGTEVRNAVAALKRDPRVKSLVLDLRDNGGGIVDGAVQVVSNFVPKGTEVLTIRGREARNRRTYKTTSSPQDTKIPLVVLVNEGTASAAEIVTGALQDLDRAVIVGRRTFGKGLVQNVRPLPYDGLVKITTGRYYIPSGRLIQAIDYGQRNEDGSVARIPDSLTTVYHTAAGREVRDGGGITPDTTVTLPESSRLLYTLYNSFVIDNFANRYANTHPEAPADTLDWHPDSTLFDDFKAFVDPAKLKYDSPYAAGIKYLRDAARVEDYLTPEVTSALDSLEVILKPDLARDIERRRTQIMEVLEDEIAARYFSTRDLSARAVEGNPDVEAARAILTDMRRYNAILRKK